MNKRHEDRKKVYMNAPENKEFYAANGAVIRNLFELSDAVEHMDEHTFSHHVNESNNDFSSWVRDVVGEHALADRLNQSKDKHQHTVSILRHLVDAIR